MKPAKYIALNREKLGMTQTALAKATYLHRNTIVNAERGGSHRKLSGEVGYVLARYFAEHIDRDPSTVMDWFHQLCPHLNTNHPPARSAPLPRAAKSSTRAVRATRKRKK